MKTPAELDKNYRELLEAQRKNSAARERAVAGLSERLRKKEASSVKSTGSLAVDRPRGTPPEMHAAALEQARAREASPPSREAVELADIDDLARELAAELRVAARRAFDTAVEVNQVELRQVVADAAHELCRRFEGMATLEAARFDLTIPGAARPALPVVHGEKIGLRDAVLQIVSWRVDGWLPDLQVLTPSMARLVKATNTNSVMGQWGFR